MDDLSTYALLITSATFVFLSFALLYRYRQVSRQITASNDLGRDLWAALEARLKKQDERILDMMGRVEVIQSRTLEKLGSEQPPNVEPKPEIASQPVGIGQAEVDNAVPSQDVTLASSSQRETSHVTTEYRLPEVVDARLISQSERLLDVLNRLDAIQARLNESELRFEPLSSLQSPPATLRVRDSIDKVSEPVLIQMLGERPRTSVEIRERFGITREHAARVLKGLFDRKLVTRNDTHKPFVYELTEVGRSMLMGSDQPPMRAAAESEKSQTG